MKHTYRYWREHKTNRTGYTVAEVTFHAEAGINDFRDEWYGKDRQTLKAAINDAKRFFKKNPDAFFGIYACATLTDYYDDGTTRFKPWEDSARLGTLDEKGDYFDMCEQVDWL